MVCLIEWEISKYWILPTRQYPHDIVGLVALDTHGAVVKLGLRFLETSATDAIMSMCVDLFVLANGDFPETEKAQQ